MSVSEKKFAVAKLQDLVSQALLAVGTSVEDASTVADLMLRSDLAGA